MLLLLDADRPDVDIHAGRDALGHVVGENGEHLEGLRQLLSDRRQYGAGRHEIAATDADLLDRPGNRRLHRRADLDLGLQARHLGLQGVDVLLLLAFDLDEVVAPLFLRRLELEGARVRIRDIEHGLVVLCLRIGDLKSAHQIAGHQTLVAGQDFLEPVGADLSGRDLLLSRRLLAAIAGVAFDDLLPVRLLEPREVLLEHGHAGDVAGELGVGDSPARCARSRCRP